LARNGKQQQGVKCAGFPILTGQERVGRQDDQYADTITSTRKKVAKPSTINMPPKAGPGLEAPAMATAIPAIKVSRVRWPNNARRAALHQGIEHHDEGARQDQQRFGQEAQQVVAPG